MSGVLWGLGQQQGPDPGQRFSANYDESMARSDRAALRGYQMEQMERQRDSQDAQQRASKHVAAGDYAGARQQAGGDPAALQQVGAQQEQAIEAHRDQYIMGARLLAGVTDEATYQRRRQIAGEMGMDLSQVPEHFDPDYVQHVVEIGTRLAPQSQGDGFTLSEGQVRYDAAGRPIASGPQPRPRYYPLAPGGRLELDPAYQGAAPPLAPPAPGTVEDGFRFRGGNPADPNNWEPVAQGGAGPAGPRNFR